MAYPPAEPSPPQPRRIVSYQPFPDPNEPAAAAPAAEPPTDTPRPARRIVGYRPFGWPVVVGPPLSPAPPREPGPPTPLGPSVTATAVPGGPSAPPQLRPEPTPPTAAAVPGPPGPRIIPKPPLPPGLTPEGGFLVPGSLKVTGGDIELPPPVRATSDLRMSPRGLEVLKQREGGFYDAPYQDTGGLAIGYGMQTWQGKRVAPDLRITKAQADAELQRQADDVYGAAVRNRLQVPVTQDQYDALVSVAFNSPAGANRIINRLNAGQPVTQADFQASATVGGQPHKGLQARRGEEHGQFENGLPPPAAPAPAPGPVAPPMAHIGPAPAQPPTLMDRLRQVVGQLYQPPDQPPPPGPPTPTPSGASDVFTRGRMTGLPGKPKPEAEWDLGKSLAEVQAGAGALASQIAHPPVVPPEPHVTRQAGDAAAMHALLDTVDGTFGVIGPPLMAVGAITNPVETMASLGTSIAFAKGAAAAADRLGFTDDHKRLIEDLASLAGAVVGGVGARAAMNKVGADLARLRAKVDAYDAAHPDLAPGAEAPPKPAGRGTTRRVVGYLPDDTAGQPIPPEPPGPYPAPPAPPSVPPVVPGSPPGGPGAPPGGPGAPPGGPAAPPEGPAAPPPRPTTPTLSPGEMLDQTRLRVQQAIVDGRLSTAEAKGYTDTLDAIEQAAKGRSWEQVGPTQRAFWLQRLADIREGLDQAAAPPHTAAGGRTPPQEAAPPPPEAAPEAPPAPTPTPAPPPSPEPPPTAPAADTPLARAQERLAQTRAELDRVVDVIDRETRQMGTLSGKPAGPTPMNVLYGDERYRDAKAARDAAEREVTRLEREAKRAGKPTTPAPGAAPPVPVPAPPEKEKEPEAPALTPPVGPQEPPPATPAEGAAPLPQTLSFDEWKTRHAAAVASGDKAMIRELERQWPDYAEAHEPEAPAPVPKPEAGPSYAISVQDTAGNWTAPNALRFATKDEAEAYSSDLLGRWMGAKDAKVVETTDPVTHRWTGQLERVEAGTPPAAPPKEEAPAPTSAPVPGVDESSPTMRIYRAAQQDYAQGLLFGERDLPALRRRIAATLKWTPEQVADHIDDLNDAIEAVFNEQMQKELPPVRGARHLAPSLEIAQRFESHLPRAHRTLEKTKLQQFSTPLPLAVGMAAAADVKPGDHVLEPTAGTGNLIAPVRDADVRVSAVELAPRRADLLKAQGIDVLRSDYLPVSFGADRPTVILSNPPWGKYSKGKYGKPIALGFTPVDVAERFVGKMVRDVADGGRIVALLPTTVLESPGFKKWLGEHEHLTVRALILSPPKAYDTRATGVDSVMLVADKVPPTVFAHLPKVVTPATWEAYADAIRAIPARAHAEPTERPAPTGPAGHPGGPSGAPPAGAPERPAPAAGPAAGRPREAPEPAAGGAPDRVPEPSGPDVADTGRDVGLPPGREPDVVAGQPGPPPERAADRAGPTVVEQPERATEDALAEPAGEFTDVVDHATDERRAAKGSRQFAPYVRRTAVAGVGHPKLIVEARQFAGAPYPPLTEKAGKAIQTALHEKRVSVEQAEQALAALQANRNGHGYLAADNVGVGKSREIALVILQAMERAKAEGRELRLVLTTKTSDNIANLVDEELYYTATGRTRDGRDLLNIDAPKEVPPGLPFEIVRTNDWPDAKREGQEYKPMPTYPRAVYVTDFYNLAAYRQAIVDIRPHGLIGDEAHRFKNVEGAAVGGAWQNLHAVIMRDVPREEQLFAYFTATPAQSVHDYQYLYGLRLWPIDGFTQWVDLVAGGASEADAEALATATERGGFNIDRVADAGGAEVVGGDSEDSPQAARPRGRGRGRSDVFTQRLTPAEAEQIPREWKMLGRFSARDLWREGQEFIVHNATLPTAHAKRYDQFVDLAQAIMKASYQFGLYDRSGKASRFGVTGQLQFAAKRIQMQPALEEAIKLTQQKVAQGYQVVLSVINVSEMDPEAGNIAAAIEKINTRIVDVDPDDPDGGTIDQGEIPEALIVRAELLEQAKALGKFEDPVKLVTDAFGADKVALVIGTSPAQRRLGMKAFQEGKRPVAFLSSAGSTGINLDHRVLTDQAPGHGRRVFIDVQFEWSATEAIQRYGRVGRSASVTQPVLMPITFGNASEKKFLATIANRMASLGALSKGGAETTGAAGYEEFEIQGPESSEAARRAYNELDDDDKRQFAVVKKVFRDPNRGHDDPFVPAATAPASAQIKDFQLALLFVPLETSNTFWRSFLRHRDEVRDALGFTSTRTEIYSGKLLRTTDLGEPDRPLTLSEVQNQRGERFGVLSGIVTPRMPQLREFLYTEDPTGHTRIFRRQYVTFTTDKDQIISGLRIPWGRVRALADKFGATLTRERLNTPAKVLEALKAGDSVPLQQPITGGEGTWVLHYRKKDGKIEVRGAKMADRTLLIHNGGNYQAVGNFWFTTEEKLKQFLERFPVAEPEAAAKPPRSGGGGQAPTTPPPAAPSSKALLDDLHAGRIDRFSDAQIDAIEDEFTRYLSAQGIEGVVRLRTLPRIGFAEWLEAHHMDQASFDGVVAKALRRGGGRGPQAMHEQPTAGPAPGTRGFVARDVIPQARRASANAVAASRGIATVFAPGSVSEPAITQSAVMRPNLALRRQRTQMQQRMPLPEPTIPEALKRLSLKVREHPTLARLSPARARQTMRDLEIAFDNLPEADQLAFAMAVDEGTIDQLPEWQQGVAELLRAITSQKRNEVNALGGKLGFIRHYFPREWVQPGKLRAYIERRLFGKRPLQGRAGFKKARARDKATNEQFTFRELYKAGFRPVSVNPVTAHLRKWLEMDKWIAGRRILLEAKRAGTAIYVKAGGRVPDGFERYPESFGTVYGNPYIVIKAGYDPGTMEALHRFADSLGVKIVQRVRMGKKWSYYVKKSATRGEIHRRFAGPEGVLMHEIGHALDEQYGLGEKIGLAQRSERREEVNFNEVPGKVLNELRKLADLRLGPHTTAWFKRYVRQRDEVIANLVHAFLYAPDLAKEVAPNAYWALYNLAKDDPQLHGLLDVQKARSLRIETEIAKERVQGYVVAGHYYGPHDAVRLMDNYLKPGLRGHLVYDVYRRAGNLLNQVQLSTSAFHAVMTSFDQIVGKTGLAMMYASRGHYLTALKKLAQAPVAPLIDVVRGNRLLRQFYAKQADFRTVVDVADAVARGGGGVGWDQFWHDSAPEHFMQALRSAVAETKAGNVPGAAVRTAALPWRAALALIELQAKPIMEFWVPRLKMAAFWDLYQLELKDLGEVPDEMELRKAAARAWDTVDNWLGQLIYDNLFWHNGLKDALMATVRAVGWDLGTLRGAVGAPAAQLRHLGLLPGAGGGSGGKPPFRTTHTGYHEEEEPDGGTRRVPTYEPRRAPWLHPDFAKLVALAFWGALFGALYQYLHTGKKPGEQDDGSIEPSQVHRDLAFPQNGGTNPDGTPDRSALPNYIKVIYGLVTHPITTAAHSLHPMIALLYDAMTNHDFYNTQIRNPEDPLIQQGKQVATWLAKQYVPISVQTYLKRRGEAGGRRGAGTESAFGISRAPQSVTQTRAEEYLRSLIPPIQRTQDEAKAAQARRDLRDAWRRGDANAVQRAYDAGLSEKQVTAAIKMADQSPIQVLFQHTNLEQALHAYEIATLEERRDLWPLLSDKYGRLLGNAPPEKIPALQDRFDRAEQLPVAAPPKAAAAGRR